MSGARRRGLWPVTALAAALLAYVGSGLTLEAALAGLFAAAALSLVWATRKRTAHPRLADGGRWFVGTYFGRVVARTWDLIGHFDLFVGILGAAVLVLGNRDVIHGDIADRILTVGAIGLIVLTLAVLAIVTPYLLWRDEHRLVVSLTSVPGINVEVVHHAMNWVQTAGGHPRDGRLLRLMVHNAAAKGHRLHARVLELEGVPPGPEVPWWTAWRHGSHLDSHLLLPGDREMLNLGWVSIDGWAHFNVVDPGISTVPNEATLPTMHCRLLVAIWDATSTLETYRAWVEVDATQVPLGVALVPVT